MKFWNILRVLKPRKDVKMSANVSEIIKEDIILKKLDEIIKLLRLIATSLANNK